MRILTGNFIFLEKIAASFSWQAEGKFLTIKFEFGELCCEFGADCHELEFTPN
jgi:hypothetical protein